MQTISAKKVFSRIALGIMLMSLVHQVLVIILSVIIAFVAPAITETGWYIWALSYVPLYLVAFPVFLLVIKGLPNHEEGGTLEKQKPSILLMLALIGACISVTIVLNLVSMGVTTLIGMLTGSEVANPLAATSMNSNPWVNFLAVSIVAPVMEEIIFRGIIYKKTVQFGGKPYIFFSAFLFAVFHGNLSQILYAFVLGLLFGAVMYATGKVRYSIILHVAINTVGSGGSTLLANYVSEEIYLVYNLLVIIVAVICIPVVIWLFVKKRKSIEYAPAEQPLPSRGVMFGNVGMVLFIVYFAIIILLPIISGALLPT